MMAVDTVISQTLARMQRRIEEKAQSGAVVNEQSGLIFLGNVHDAVPRRLFLDCRLSPLDKMAWIMIRLYAQQNEGAVFPTYDELQCQLASPHAQKASRETVSRTLIMLRLTGWLSLCKRVRDKSGRVRGNIYAQHDEPVSLRDAEYFDPGWLDCVAECCRHTNKTIRMTALAVLTDIKNDMQMRHRHSRIALIEARLQAPQTPQAILGLKAEKTLSSECELSQPDLKMRPETPGSEAELGVIKDKIKSGTETEPSRKQGICNPVRKTNRYVRSFTQRVKETYVKPNNSESHAMPLIWSTRLIERIEPDERDMLEAQLKTLPDGLGQQVLDDLSLRLKTAQIHNVVAYLLTNIKRARQGQFNVVGEAGKTVPAISAVTNTYAGSPKKTVKRAKREFVSQILAEIRAEL